MLENTEKINPCQAPSGKLRLIMIDIKLATLPSDPKKEEYCIPQGDFESLGKAIETTKELKEKMGLGVYFQIHNDKAEIVSHETQFS